MTLFDEVGQTQGDFIEFLISCDRKISPPVWALMLMFNIGNWSEESWRFVYNIEGLVELFLTSGNDPNAVASIDAAYQAVAAIGSMVFGNRQDASKALGLQLARLAPIEEAKDSKNAYDLASFATGLINGSPIHAQHRRDGADCEGASGSQVTISTECRHRSCSAGSIARIAVLVALLQCRINEALYRSATTFGGETLIFFHVGEEFIGAAVGKAHLWTLPSGHCRSGARPTFSG